MFPAGQASAASVTPRLHTAWYWPATTALAVAASITMFAVMPSRQPGPSMSKSLSLLRPMVSNCHHQRELPKQPTATWNSETACSTAAMRWPRCLSNRRPRRIRKPGRELATPGLKRINADCQAAFDLRFLLSPYQKVKTMQTCCAPKAMVFLLGLMMSQVAAAEPPSESPPKIVEFTVTAAGPSDTGQMYRLQPGFMDRSNENAALLYLKAFLILQSEQPAADRDKVEKWLQMPLAELPLPEVQTLVDRSTIFDLLTLASRRGQCDWGLPIREEKNVFGIMLPEATAARDAARLLALRRGCKLPKENIATPAKPCGLVCNSAGTRLRDSFWSMAWLAWRFAR